MKTKLFVVSAVCLVAVLCFVAPASAQTIEEQIQALMAQIQALQQQIVQLQATPATDNITQQTQPAQPTSSTPWCHTFNITLKLGDTGEEVRALQIAFQKEGFNVSQDTSGVFGPYTRRASILFQQKYASEILAPYGLTKGTGYVALTTRRKLNTLYGCGTAYHYECKNLRCVQIAGVGTNQCLSHSNCATQPVCTPNWFCTSWNDCVSGVQTRTCTDSSNCGVLTGKPEVNQSCVVCAPSWQCSSWSACTNGAQTRTCTDSNSCGVVTNKPAVTQSCAVAVFTAQTHPATNVNYQTHTATFNGSVSAPAMCHFEYGLTPPYYSHLTPSVEIMDGGNFSANVTGLDSISTGLLIHYQAVCTSLSGSVAEVFGGDKFFSDTSCKPYWTCSEWKTCFDNGFDSRSCVDANHCPTEVGRPDEVRQETCTCQEGFTYGPWMGTLSVGSLSQDKTCLNGGQARTYSGNSCIKYGWADRVDVFAQACTDACSPRWTCSPWSQCAGGTQSRTCIDSNNCEIAIGSTGTPLQRRSCIENPIAESVLRVITNPASDVTAITATLNGVVSAPGGGHVIPKVWFEYGTTTSYGKSTLMSMVFGGGHFFHGGFNSSTWTEFSPGTTYHYRAVSTDNFLSTVYGEDKTFTTLPSTIGGGNVCNPNWQCGPWSVCTNSVQTRACADANNCQTSLNKPSESQSCAPVQPSITVTSPNGGEIFEKGKDITINWTSQGLNTVYVRVNYYNTSGVLEPLNQMNSATCRITISPVDAALGTYTIKNGMSGCGLLPESTRIKFKVYGYLTNGAGYSDLSDNYVSVVPQTTSYVPEEQLASISQALANISNLISQLVSGQ